MVINSAFWTHTIWFILLGIVTILELAMIFRRADDRKLALALYLTICGMTFSFEMIVLSFFKAYRYFPMVFPESPPDDNIVGNLFSQFSVSATALLLAVFGLNFIWHLIFAAAYGAIEEGFLALDIYRHNWYQTWMTVAALLLLFWIAKRAYGVCLTHLGRRLRYLFIFFGLITLHEHAIVWVLRLTGVRLLNEHVMGDPERSFVVISGAYMLILGVAVMWLYFSNIRWRWKLPAIALLYFGHWIAAEVDLIIYKEGWTWIAASISIWGMYLFTLMLDKLYGRRGWNRYAGRRW